MLDLVITRVNRSSIVCLCGGRGLIIGGENRLDGTFVCQIDSVKRWRVPYDDQAITASEREAIWEALVEATRNSGIAVVKQRWATTQSNIDYGLATLFVNARWGARIASTDEIVRQTVDLLDSFSRISELLSNWTSQPMHVDDRHGFAVRTESDIRRLLECFATPDKIDKEQRHWKLNGATKNLRMRLSAGANETPNSLRIELPAAVSVELEKSVLFRPVFEAIVRSFAPDWVTLRCMEEVYALDGPFALDRLLYLAAGEQEPEAISTWPAHLVRREPFIDGTLLTRTNARPLS